MNADEIKDYALETCKTPLQMDLHQMSQGLEKWGFKIVEYENLGPELPMLPIYLVWLDCDYGHELARTNAANWINECKFPWLGRWHFVVSVYYKADKPRGEIEFSCERYMNGVWAVKNLKGAPVTTHGTRKAMREAAEAARREVVEDRFAKLHVMTKAVMDEVATSKLPPGTKLSIEQYSDCADIEITAVPPLPVENIIVNLCP